MHTPLLRDYFLAERHQCKKSTGSCLVCELSRLFQVDLISVVIITSCYHSVMYSFIDRNSTKAQEDR